MPEKVGDESLKIGDKEYKCVVWKAKGKRGDKETESKVWMCDTVSAPLKLESKSGEEEGSFTATQVSDKVKGAGKEYDCVKLEGTLNNQLGKMKTTLWLNADIPGGAVCMKMEGEGDMGAKISIDLSEVDAKK
jgi:hypothetical protein